MSRKIKMSIHEFVVKYPISYSVLEDKAGLPRGTLSQYLHKNSTRVPKEATLKKLQSGLHSIGKGMTQIELVNKKSKDEQSGTI